MTSGRHSHLFREKQTVHGGPCPLGHAGSADPLATGGGTLYQSQQVGGGNAELLCPMSADQVACCMQAPMTAVEAVAPLLRHLSQVGLLLVVCMQAAWN